MRPQKTGPWDSQTISLTMTLHGLSVGPFPFQRPILKETMALRNATWKVPTALYYSFHNGKTFIGKK